MSFQIRPAQPTDLPSVARLAGELVRLHHGFDPDRFMKVDNVERGYERWFRTELGNSDAVVLVAIAGPDAAPPLPDGGRLLGYAYGRLEGRDWNALLDAHGAIHDVFVEPAARQHGVARALMQALIDELVRRGATRVLLHTATPNVAAQRLFRSLGFRDTMLEMTFTPTRH